MQTQSLVSGSRKTARQGKSKLFQCTGYGNCSMVFTRSEHLARHMRKHTGEKPFKCIVEGCERMFSRFDNMMQHTQTHNKSQASRRTKTSSLGHERSKRNKKHTTRKKQRAGSQDSFPDDGMSSGYYNGVTGLPSPPASRRGSLKGGHLSRRRSHATEFDDDDDDDEEEDDEEDEENGDSDASYTPPKNKHRVTKQQRHFNRQEAPSYDAYPSTFPHTYSSAHPHAQAYVYPPPTESLQGSNPTAHMYHQHPFPVSPPSLGSYSSGDEYVLSRHRHMSKFDFNYTGQYRRHSDDFLAGKMILPRIASYLVQHPDAPPESYLLHHEQDEAESMSSPSKSTSSTSFTTRRLSVQDLCNPINSLNQLPQADQPSKSDKDNDSQSQPDLSGPGVDVTQDEFEALQGLGQLQQ